MAKLVKPYLAPAQYIRIAGEFDRLGLFEVLSLARGECPSRGWFRIRARLNRFLIAQHEIQETHLILRLK